jgi:hypothetical protein
MTVVKVRVKETGQVIRVKEWNNGYTDARGDFYARADVQFLESEKL